MSDQDKPQPHDPGVSGIREMTHKNRRIKIREAGNTFELSINEVPMKVSRHKDGTYHSNILTHQSFDSADELARALAEIEGKLWVAGPGTIHHGPTPHGPGTPHDPDTPHEH
jgi:hypothetical protein